MMRESDAFRKISDTTHSLNNGKKKEAALIIRECVWNVVDFL